MKIRITKPGLFGSTGEVAVGTEVSLKEAPKGWAGRYEVISKTADDQTAVINPEKWNGYIVTPKSPGWFVITKDGAPVTKALREKDIEAFEASDDPDAFVEAHKAEG